MPVIDIEVVYAAQNSYRCISLKVQIPCTLKKAIDQSGILTLFPEIDLSKNQVGIYNQIKSLYHLVEQGDRVEIYRPLHQSAMAARLQRVKDQKDQKHKSLSAKKPPPVKSPESL